MRTSEEILHRVRWDARFDPARFVMGVNRRGAGVKRMPLTSFVPGGEIPWHRVLFIEADGELVWDRASGADLIGSTGAGLARDPRRLRAPFFEPLAFDGPAGRTPDGRPIRVLTWNTLWDRYGSEHIDTARRRPLLLAALREADADVIALQEVEPELLAMVRAQPWIHDTYTLSPGTREVAEYGLLLLSRAPVREVGRHAFGPHKAVLAMVVETGHGPLTVATTHLTSDHSAEGPASREKQLARLTEGLAGVPGDVVLMGDFNDATDRPQRTLDLDDAWIRVHGPGDDRPTFDPSANPLAALGSLTGEPGRIDRVLLRGPVALRAVLRGEGEFISDHYGVEVELTGAPDAGAGGARAGGARDAGAGARDTGAEGARVVGRDAGAAGVRAAGTGDPEGVEALVRRVRAAVSGALPEGVVHLAGSRRTGCAAPGADLDLVAALPGGAVDPASVRARIVDALPEAAAVREVIGARAPGLRFRVAGLAVDLVVVATGEVPPGAAVERRAELGEAAAIALSAVSDADAVLRLADGRREAFTALAREVKTWARARGLDSAPFGGVPGIGWTVLAARTVAKSPRPPEGGRDEVPLSDFFARWAVWDWAGGEVLTPSEPVRTCTGQLSTGGRELVLRELYRGWEITEAAAGPRPELWAAPSLGADHTAWAVVTIAPGSTQAGAPAAADPAADPVEETEGRLRGRMRALLTALAEAGSPDAYAWPRALPGDPVRYAIGLGATPPDAVRLAEIGDSVLRGLPGTALAPAARGELPPELR